MGEKQQDIVSAALQNAFGGIWRSPDGGERYIAIYDHKGGNAARSLLDHYNVQYGSERTNEGFLFRATSSAGELLNAAIQYKETQPAAVSATSGEAVVIKEAPDPELKHLAALRQHLSYRKIDWQDYWNSIRNPKMEVIHQQNVLRHFLNSLQPKPSPDFEWRYDRDAKNFILSLPADPDNIAEIAAVGHAHAALKQAGFTDEQLNKKEDGGACHFTLEPKNIVQHPAYEEFRVKYDPKFAQAMSRGKLQR